MRFYRRPLQYPVWRTVRRNSCAFPCRDHTIQYQLGAFKILQVIALLCGLLLLGGSAAAQTKPTRRILILNHVGTSYPGINIIDKGIRSALESSPYQLEFYTEYMDAILFPDPADQQRFRDFLIRKYENRRPDVIMTVGPAPVRFMIESQRTYFSGVPIVFCLPNGTGPGAPELNSDFTGIENDMAPAETLAAALRLQPGTRHVVVVGGTSSFERQQEAMVKDRLKSYEGQLDISYVTDLAMPDLLEHLRHLPNHTVVLFLAIDQDAAGARFISGSEAAPMVVAAANAPVFSLYDVYLNHGEVGGDLSSLSEMGRLAGTMALRILNGEKPSDIPRMKNTITYMFDWRAIKRWRLKEENLPPGSIVLNRQPTVWEAYKWYIIGGISLICFEAILISGLMWQRARRRRAEADLAMAFEVVKESEHRFRVVANAAPVMIWMSGPDKLCTYVNQPWLDITGRPFEAEMGSGWLDGIHPEDLNACLMTYTQSFDRREPFTMQYRLRQSEGIYRWVLDRGVPRFDPDGSFAGYIGSCIDITDCKLAEEALADISRRLIDAQEQERMRIARELHDDINQPLALLEIELDLLQQRLPDSASEIRSRLHELQLRIPEIGSEIQAISHRLHSSKLQYLGLVPACKSFCREIAERHKVAVDFAAETIPSELAQDLSLCIFRVLQEALNNAIKHSGAQHFEVCLRGISGEIQLTVRDCGIGFDAKAAMNSQGLGLISMRERVSLAKGTMSITSKPTGGTEITIRVPAVATEASNGLIPGILRA